MKKTFLTLSLVLLALSLPRSAFAAKMALSPASGEFHTGCPTAISIVINTEGADSSAADAFLSYNPDEIEIVDQMAGSGGIQIRQGSVYESYPGNITGNGRIRLTAFNRQGYYNGRGVLGSIVIKGKPGVAKTTINFDFSPGRTTDSNVSDPSSVDIMDAGYGGTYRFTAGSCGSDSTPPWIEDAKPANGDFGIKTDTEVAFTIKDNSAGVDLDTLKVYLNDDLYTEKGVPSFTAEGKPGNYRIVIKPQTPFLEREPVVVRIDATDKAGNAMKQTRYAFNELIPVGSCPVVQPTTETIQDIDTVRPAAPETRAVTSWWPWWFVLLCSLILNLKLWIDRQRKMEEKKASRLPLGENPVVQPQNGFQRHQISPTVMPKKRKIVKKARR